MNRQGKLYLDVCRYWLGAEACVWLEHFISLVSPCCDTSSFLCSSSLWPYHHLSDSFTITFPSLPFVYRCLCVCVCEHILAVSCGPGRTPNGKRFYHYVWLAISLHSSSTLADRASCSITLLPLGPTIHRQARIHTQKHKHSRSHTP